MHITKRLFLAAAMAAALAGPTSARTITVTENKGASGLTTSFDLAFSADSETHSLWMAYGKADGGDRFDGWANVRYLGEVSGDVTSMTAVPVPDGWGSDVYRIRFILASGGDIPGGQLLDYIQANGNGNTSGQYVKTGFTPNGNSAVTIDFERTQSGNHSIFCARDNVSNTDKTFMFWVNAEWRWYYGNHTYKRTTSNLPGTTRHVVHADWHGITMDGTLVDDATASAEPLDYTAGGEMYIFASYAGGFAPTVGNRVSAKLYSFKAWTNGADTATIALDLVPCKKNDGTVCLYDKAYDRFLTNSGTGVFTAGNVIPSKTTEPQSVSDIVTYPLPGWLPSNGDYFPYDDANPLYVVEVAAGVSQSIDQATFKEIYLGDASITNDIPYATFVASSRNGTILKRGGGTLTFDRPLSSFTGPVHIEEGVAIGISTNCFGYTINDDTARETQRVYVHSGATLVMDSNENTLVRPDANAIYYEGDGYPGLGGALVARNGDVVGNSKWALGSHSRAVGPAVVFLDVPSESQVLLSGYSPTSDFSFNGQDVLLCGRDVGTLLSVDGNSFADIGNLVVSNMTLSVNNGAWLPPKDSGSTIRFCGGARWAWPKDYTGSGQTATLHVDDLEYASFGASGSGNNGLGVEPWGASDAKKYYWYNGPVALDGDFCMFNVVDSYSGWNYSAGCTFESEVRGSGGFRPYFDENNRNRGNLVRLNLLNPTNTFEGGIVLARGSLGVYGAKAVPSHEGAGIVSITNGYVYFGRKLESAAVTNSWVNFTMPVTEFVNNGAVTNGTGVFKGLVKKGTGTLDYNSQMGGDYLDLQGGTVAFNTQYRDAYTGDNAAAAPSGYAAALPVFTTLKGTAGALDLAGASWTVSNVEGSPCVTNGNLTVTGAWTVDTATAGENPVRVSGTLSFGQSATVTLADGFESERSVLLAKAAAIDGMPQLVGGDGWQLIVFDGELRLASHKPTVISFR